MSAKSKFEQGLEYLDKAMPLLREGLAEHDEIIRQRIFAAIGGGQISSPLLTSVAPSKAETGKAPRGAAREFVKKLLTAAPRGMVWGDIEDAAKNSGEITHWAIRKEINKGRKDGRYALRSGRWILKEAS